MTKVLIFSVLLLTFAIFLHKLNNKCHKCHKIKRYIISFAKKMNIVKIPSKEQ